MDFQVGLLPSSASFQSDIEQPFLTRTALPVHYQAFSSKRVNDSRLHVRVFYEYIKKIVVKTVIHRQRGIYMTDIVDLSNIRGKIDDALL